jgi:hypothetical protein
MNLASCYRLTYYWCQQSDETTALGEPRPGPEGRIAPAQATPRQQARVVAGSLGQLVAVGAGISIAFALLARIF